MFYLFYFNNYIFHVLAVEPITKRQIRLMRKRLYTRRAQNSVGLNRRSEKLVLMEGRRKQVGGEVAGQFKSC